MDGRAGGAEELRFGRARPQGRRRLLPVLCAAFDRDVALPLLILIGDKDDWTLADDCRKLQAAGFSRPDLVEVVYYPTAYHSFDSKGADRTITVADGKSHRLAYDPSAAPDAETRTRTFFARYLR